MRGNNMATTRINANTAMLLKSRVALYEGTFEKNFAGTAFVPGTAEWPGKSKDYNSSFTFKSGSAENEVKYFLEEAIKAAEIVAEEAKGRLTLNPKKKGANLPTTRPSTPGWQCSAASIWADIPKYCYGASIATLSASTTTLSYKPRKATRA